MAAKAAIGLKGLTHTPGRDLDTKGYHIMEVNSTYIVCITQYLFCMHPTYSC